MTAPSNIPKCDEANCRALSIGPLSKHPIPVCCHDNLQFIGQNVTSSKVEFPATIVYNKILTFKHIQLI